MLLFPLNGSVENRFPSGPPPAEIVLGEAESFIAVAPYGVDTYFLLTTDEPLSDPRILEWDGVRDAEPSNALEELLMITASGERAPPPSTPGTWSIEKVFYEAVPPRASSKTSK